MVKAHTHCPATLEVTRPLVTGPHTGTPHTWRVPCARPHPHPAPHHAANSEHTWE